MPPVAAPGVASQEPCLSSLVRYAHRIKADGRSLAPGHAMGRRLFPQPARFCIPRLAASCLSSRESAWLAVQSARGISAFSEMLRHASG